MNRAVSTFQSRLRALSPAQVLVIGFASLILAGSLLLSLPVASATGQPHRYLDALFTATSAVCVSGLVVVDTGTSFSPFGQLVILALIQTGGLGFMTISTSLALLIGKRIGLRERLLIQEAFNQFNLSGLVRLIRHVLAVTLIFEGTGAILLAMRFMSTMPFAQALYYGVFHSVSAFCNAGFDLFGRIYGPFSSLSAYVNDWLVNSVVTALIIIGGLGFTVLLDLQNFFRGGRLSLHTRLVITVTVTLIVVGTVMVFLLEFNNPLTLGKLPPSGKVLASFFQAVTPRTAGFNTLDIGKFKEATLFLMIILMFIGASPSSTGGGIKTTTLGSLMVTVWATIRGRKEVELYERRLPMETVFKSLTVALISLSLVILVTLILNVTEKFSFLEILFEVTSAFGTVGLTTGITPFLSDLGRILIMATMFSGRIGLFTIAVALARRMQVEGTYRYVEEKVIIG